MKREAYIISRPDKEMQDAGVPLADVILLVADLDVFFFNLHESNANIISMCLFMSKKKNSLSAN
jgi:hypothetical protein